MSIPKIIHYCWFGKNPKSELALKCIESWKRYCPDYEIIEWNEDNFDICYCDYVREAYEAKKWAFVSDVARLYALVNCGGIYMDTDVELLKSLDEFLVYEAVSGFEAKDRIPTGLMACRKEHPLFMELLHDYDDAHFIYEDGTFNTTTNVIRITNICLQHGLRLDNTLQTVKDFTLFPNDYFCPKSHEDGIVRITPNTYAIHWFAGSWLDKDKKEMQTLMQRMNRCFGQKNGEIVFGIYSCIKAEGLGCYLWNRIRKYIRKIIETN